MRRLEGNIVSLRFLLDTCTLIEAEAYDQAPTVKVKIPFQGTIDYAIKVFRPDDLDEIKQKLRSLNPILVDLDDSFFERLKKDWFVLISRITKNEVTVIS